MGRLAQSRSPNLDRLNSKVPPMWLLSFRAGRSIKVVKCLVSYHPDDPAELKGRGQDRQMQRLFDAYAARHVTNCCSKSFYRERCLWIPETMARAIAGIYALEGAARLVETAAGRQRGALASRSRYDWTRGSAVSRGPASGTGAARDRCYSRASPTQRRSESVKGFAVGRTIFQDVARAWFPGSMSDADAMQGDGRKIFKVGECVRRARATAVAI